MCSTRNLSQKEGNSELLKLKLYKRPSFYCFFLLNIYWELLVEEKLNEKFQDVDDYIEDAIILCKNNFPTLLSGQQVLLLFRIS